MRDKYLYMKTKNNKSLKCMLVDNEYKFYYCDYSDPLANKKVIRPKIHLIDNSVQTILIFDNFAFRGLYLDDKDVLCYEIAFCKHCGSLNVIRKDHNTRKVFNSCGELTELKLKRYECKSCGRKSQVELLGVFSPYAKIPDFVKESVRLSLHNGHKTLRQHSKDIKLYSNIPCSHETARKSLFTNNAEAYKKWDFQISGHMAYDAQHLPQNKETVYRLVLIDTITSLPIAEAIVEKEDNKTIYDFINKSTPSFKRKSIVTDSKSGYEKVMRYLGFNYHQNCVFHLLQRINDLINEQVNDFKKEYKAELKASNPNYSQQKLNTETKNAAKKYRKQFEPYHDEIKEIFDQETHEDAVKHVEKIKSKIDTYPDFLSEYLIENFFPVYKRYIVFLEKEVKGYLPKTDNLCENYIGKIIDKKVKGKFKTILGAFDYIVNRAEGWIKNHQPKLTFI